jgi:hypothetical protein
MEKMCPWGKDKVRERMWPEGEDGLIMVPWEGREMGLGDDLALGKGVWNGV